MVTNVSEVKAVAFWNFYNYKIQNNVSNSFTTKTIPNSEIVLKKKLLYLNKQTRIYIYSKNKLLISFNQNLTTKLHVSQRKSLKQKQLNVVLHRGYHI